MKQTDLLNLHITLIHKAFAKKMSYELSYLGIERNYLVLWAIDQLEDVSQQKLADLFRVDKATMLRTINELLKAKLITRDRDPNDQRKYQISLSNKAQKMIPSIKETINTLTQKMTDGFSKEEKDVFAKLLSRAYDNYTKLFHNIPMQELTQKALQENEN